MDCHEIETLELAEKYVTGQLGDAEQQSYEEHYFQCSACLEQLQLLQSMHAELENMQPRASVEPVQRRRFNWLAFGLAAAAVLVAVGVTWAVRSRSAATPAPVTTQVQAPADHTPALELLARVDPPGYTAPTLRGTPAGSGQFREGMALYRVGNYEAAIPVLTSAAAADPKSPDPQFFLGICYLLTGHTD